MNHTELGPEEKSLIAAARAAHAPTELQRARVRKGLDAKLAAGIAAPILASSTALAMAGKVGAGIAIVAAVGAGAVYVATPRPPRKPASSTEVKASLATAPALPLPAPTLSPSAIAEPPPAPAAISHPLPSPPRNAARRRETSPSSPADLAGELTLLTQASAATQQGDVARADELLRAYDQRFPSGQLTQERAAAGILVLCASGRVQAARSEARRFLERWPRSPLVPRINSSCAVGDKAP